MTIVHYEYRYKRPPRKKPKKPALEVPAVVRAKPTRRPGNTRPADVDDDRKPSPTSAIVTIRKRCRADVRRRRISGVAMLPRRCSAR
jgi:hypothetical protein